MSGVTPRPSSVWPSGQLEAERDDLQERAIGQVHASGRRGSGRRSASPTIVARPWSWRMAASCSASASLASSTRTTIGDRRRRPRRGRWARSRWARCRCGSGTRPRRRRRRGAGASMMTAGAPWFEARRSRMRPSMASSPSTKPVRASLDAVDGLLAGQGDDAQVADLGSAARRRASGRMSGVDLPARSSVTSRGASPGETTVSVTLGALGPADVRDARARVAVHARRCGRGRPMPASLRRIRPRRRRRCAGPRRPRRPRSRRRARRCRRSSGRPTSGSPRSSGE